MKVKGNDFIKHCKWCNKPLFTTRQLQYHSTVCEKKPNFKVATPKELQATRNPAYTYIIP